MGPNSTMMHAQESFMTTTSGCGSSEKCSRFVRERNREQSSLNATRALLSDHTFQAIIEVQNWIHTEGRSCRTMSSMVRSLALQMRMRGIPVDRLYLGTTVIHPQAAAFIWKWDSTGKEFEGECSSDAFVKLREETRDAPLNQLEFLDTIRIKATDTYIPSETRTLFEDEGYVDMYGLPYYAHDRFGGGITWATKRKIGFTDRELAFFGAVMPAISILVQLMLNNICMSSIFKTYLGKDPGTRVHSGSIERGDCITVRSVIWFSDIRGFSELSAKLKRDEVLQLVNEVSEVTETVFAEKGGEILKFLGDGVMGVFTAEGNDEASVCRRAREAAEMVQTAMKKLRAVRSAKGLPGVEVGIGLHFGDASYGNIGSRNRLDFTLIGHSVNIASRIEGLCSGLKISVLASEDFVRLDSGTEVWSTCGKHQLKGVKDSVEVFELSNAGTKS